MQAVLPLREKAATVKEHLIEACLDGGYWEPTNKHLCFSFGQRDDFPLAAEAKYGPAIQRDPSRMLTVHFVPGYTAEHAAVQEVAKAQKAGGFSELAFVFRVQNYELAPQFCEAVTKAQVDPLTQPRNLLFGFHGLKDHNMDWANVFLNGLDPNQCKEGNYGMGAYLASNPGLSLSRYSHKFSTPVYRDIFDRFDEPQMDSYAIIGMFLVNVGEQQYKSYFGQEHPTLLPPDHGAFISPDLSQICIQDHRRICPAYMLLYTEKNFKDKEPRYSWDFTDEQAEWSWRTHMGHHMQRSVYLESGDQPFDEIQSKLERDQDGFLDETGRWDARSNDPQDLACRLCEMELGWRRASPLVLPNETVPYFCRQSGRKYGYTADSDPFRQYRQPHT